MGKEEHDENLSYRYDGRNARGMASEGVCYNLALRDLTHYATNE